MADFFVDKMLQNVEAEKNWYRNTKAMFKLHKPKFVFEKVYEAFAETVEINYKGKFPSYIFKDDGINIIQIANDFGLKPLNSKLRICPFHKDKAPSLSLSKEKNIFHCFGCKEKGNLISFYAKLKILKKRGDLENYGN